LTVPAKLRSVCNWLSRSGGVSWVESIMVVIVFAGFADVVSTRKTGDEEPQGNKRQSHRRAFRVKCFKT
jgi:hypothetical protein